MRRDHYPARRAACLLLGTRSVGVLFRVDSGVLWLWRRMPMQVAAPFDGLRGAGAPRTFACQLAGEREHLGRAAFGRRAARHRRVLRAEREGKLCGLLADCSKLVDHFRVGAGIDGFEARLERIDAGAERRGPAAQGVHDRAQRRQYRTGGLPAIGRDHAAHRTAVEVRTLVATQFFERIERILHETGDTAVVAGGGDDQRVGFAHGFDQLELGVGALRIFRGVVRQAMQERAAEQAGTCTRCFRAAQCKTEGTLGRRCRTRGAADADDERPALVIETGQRNAPSVAAAGGAAQGCAQTRPANGTWPAGLKPPS
jgi:hypothetical protein